MTHTHHALNIQQYQDKSQNYLNSAVHAQGAEFDKIKQLIEAHKLKHILDLGCGGGHVSYQVAPVATSVIAYDITPQYFANKLSRHTPKLKEFRNFTPINSKFGINSEH